MRTRYDSSILLWEKFTSVSQDTRQWVESALETTTSIASSLEPPGSLLPQLEVRPRRIHFHHIRPISGRPSTVQYDDWLALSGVNLVNYYSTCESKSEILWCSARWRVRCQGLDWVSLYCYSHETSKILIYKDKSLYHTVFSDDFIPINKLNVWTNSIQSVETEAAVVGVLSYFYTWHYHCLVLLTVRRETGLDFRNINALTPPYPRNILRRESIFSGQILIEIFK